MNSKTTSTRLTTAAELKDCWIIWELNKKESLLSPLCEGLNKGFTTKPKGNAL